MKGKALFLLSVFLLNTLWGFGCTVRLNMLDHPMAKKLAYTEPSHGQKHPGRDHHQQVKPFLPIEDNTVLSNPDPCCQKSTGQFLSLVKDTPNGGKPLFKLPILDLSYQVEIGLRALVYLDAYKANFIPFTERPPAWDIRTAIQSFQI